MESVHGVDVSWMHRTTSNSLKENRTESASRSHNGPGVQSPPEPQNGTQARGRPESPKPINIPTRPGFSRSNSSTERAATLNGVSKTPPSGTSSRRNSWLSSISSKFSPGSHNGGSLPNTSPTATPSDAEVNVPTGPNSPRNAVLPHGAKSTGDVPYTPAPPKTTQPGFLQSAFRRLSSSSGQLSNNSKGSQHGLCERKVLNVDPHRERCHILELNQAKLRRVAFCVDVEIASGPRYKDDSDEEKKAKREKKCIAEKAEEVKSTTGAARQNEKNETESATGSSESLSNATKKDGIVETIAEAPDESPAGDKEVTKKKEKKKRSEEERKARKDKKRRLAEANGTIPVELVRDELNGSQSSLHSVNGTGSPKTQASPTTDPVRIYRRCCQLRETPILKKITEQLVAQSPTLGTPGLVHKLDLTGYWMQLSDLITLGDYLAVVPVKELIMENCGLTDEGIRVILAGLLAAKLSDSTGTRRATNNHGEVAQGGVVERLVLKNNSKIGRDGWRHICLFINMCRSLKTLDLSKVPFPQASIQPAAHHHSGFGHHTGPGHLSRTPSTLTSAGELSCLLSKAIGGRLAGRDFELLNVAECGISAEQLSDLVDGIIKSGLRRLGLAGNSITPEGMQHVSRFLKSGHCEGLDLGGNNLKDHLGLIADSLGESSPLYALSLRDCNLTTDSLCKLFPALVHLQNFRFIDLSQNHTLFDTKPNAISLLRRYLPKLPMLKRIHLTDVSMTSEQAIAIAEILPDIPHLAHVSLMENKGLIALANATDETSQEEACALYASLMAAVRVSKTIICIDIEVPSIGSSEVVKALAKQVVAFCLYNMERGPVAEISEAAAALSEPHGGEKEPVLPDVLVHLVGHQEGSQIVQDDDEPAPDDDYVIGGSGLVKALGICLRNCGNDSRRPSSDRTLSTDIPEANSGSVTPRIPISGGKAKQMSTSLLESARRIRGRLQPALLKESRFGTESSNYMRLAFLDRTLEGMIKRFEDEFPETRLPALPDTPFPPILDAERLPQSSPVGSLEAAQPSDPEDYTLVEAPPSDDEDGNATRPGLSRHNSDVSLASKAFTEEEGRMHRFGQKFRRDILKPEGEDHAHGTSGREMQTPHMVLLRAMVEGLHGEEIRKRIESDGQDAVLQELSDEASTLRRELIEQDPAHWKRFAESMEMSKRNSQVAGAESFSAIE